MNDRYSIEHLANGLINITDKLTHVIETYNPVTRLSNGYINYDILQQILKSEVV